MIEYYKSNIESSIFNLISDLLVKNLFGTLLTVSIIFTGVSLVVNNDNIKKVSSNTLSVARHYCDSDPEYGQQYCMEREKLIDYIAMIGDYWLEKVDTSKEYFLESDNGVHELYDEIGNITIYEIWGDEYNVRYLKDDGKYKIFYAQSINYDYHYEFKTLTEGSNMYIISEEKVNGKLPIYKMNVDELIEVTD